jgi:hypothetical protein
MLLLGFSSLLEYMQMHAVENNPDGAIAIDQQGGGCNSLQVYHSTDGGLNMNGVFGMINGPMNPNQEVELEEFGNLNSGLSI